MGDANPICTLRDYSKPSHKGNMNTIELPVWNNVVPLRSDTIRLVQNECSFHGLWIRHHMGGSYYLFPCLIFPSGRTAKLRNDIPMFQQHHGESLSEAWTRFKDLLQKVPHYGIDHPEQAFVEYASSRTDKVGAPKRVHFVNSVIILNKDNDIKQEDVSSNNAHEHDLESMVRRKKEANDQGKDEDEMGNAKKDVQEKPYDVGVKYKASSIPERTTQPMVLEKHKGAEDLAADHLSRLENSHMEVLTEREIADEFPDKHLMLLKSKFNDDEP
nr:hypothetical protein [Tanacetum cinerariifolium]